MHNKAFTIFLLLTLWNCSGNKQESEKTDESEIDYATSIKIKQYVAEGRNLYNTFCSNCHQVNGDGLAALFPPVRNSDYLMRDIGRAVCNIKNGVKGEIKVNGKLYDQEMPANNALTNLDLAEIMTYMLNEMNDSTAIVTTSQVRDYLKECSAD